MSRPAVFICLVVASVLAVSITAQTPTPAPAVPPSQPMSQLPTSPALSTPCQMIASAIVLSASSMLAVIALGSTGCSVPVRFRGARTFTK